MKGEMYVAFNASHLPVVMCLPERGGYTWQPLIDTSKPPPYDFMDDDVADRQVAEAQFRGLLEGNAYPLLGYSAIVLTQRWEPEKF